jgi:hypothetical protein
VFTVSCIRVAIVGRSPAVGGSLGSRVTYPDEVVGGELGMRRIVEPFGR